MEPTPPAEGLNHQEVLLLSLFPCFYLFLNREGNDSGYRIKEDPPVERERLQLQKKMESVIEGSLRKV